MESNARSGGLSQRWWALFLVVGFVGVITLTAVLFSGVFKSYVLVTLTSDRAGLVMDTGGKVKMRGVQVGRIGAIGSGGTGVSLQLEIFPDQVKYIPANVEARIRATTAFGAKYVDLMYPTDPSPARIANGQILHSQNVSTEVNTVFQNLVNVLSKIEPEKLNAVLSALAEGFRGEGPTIGQATSAANEVLLEINPRANTLARDWRSLKGFGDTYNAAAKDIISVLDSASTTSLTITSQQKTLDHLLVSSIGLANSGISVLGPSKDDYIAAINGLEPTTDLLWMYSPEFTCSFEGAKRILDWGWAGIAGGTNGKGLLVDIALLPGDDPYKYPDNLPIIGAKGGPGGKPGCGSLPDVSKNFPQRYLVTNTGWGTGLDLRPNPGIGFPGWADFFPVTRGVPKPPSVRYPGGPASGPVPYPGAPPYGAPLYGADGTPLYPGLPAAPAPGAARDPGPAPGSEPFTVANPAQLQPTPTPPLPERASPAP